MTIRIYLKMAIWIIAAAAMISCQSNQEINTGIRPIFLTDSVLISKSKPISGHNIKFEEGMVLGPLTDICKINEQVYFFEQVMTNDCFGALVDIENQEIMTKIGHIGDGPMELTNLFDWYKTNDSIYFFDLIANKLVVTDIEALRDSTAQLSEENSLQYILKPEFYVDMLVILDDQWITRNYNFENPDSALVELSPNTLEPVRYFGELPDYATDASHDTRLRLVENLAYSAVHPNGNLFVLAYKFENLIEIYNADGDIVKSIMGPGNNLPELSESSVARFDPVPVYDKTWYSYRKVIARADGFYLGYVGKREPPASAYSVDGPIFIQSGYCFDGLIFPQKLQIFSHIIYYIKYICVYYHMCKKQKYNLVISM